MSLVWKNNSVICQNIKLPTYTLWACSPVGPHDGTEPHLFSEFGSCDNSHDQYWVNNPQGHSTGKHLQKPKEIQFPPYHHLDDKTTCNMAS